MALNAKGLPSTGGSSQPVLEAGNYLARLVQVVDLGMQPQRPYQGQTKDPCYSLRLVYELGTEFCLDEDGKEDETRPRWMGEELPFYPLSTDRAKCTKRYNAFDPSHKEEGDWEKLLGKPCTVTITNSVSKKNGRTYANVSAVTPPMKGVPVPELVNEATSFDMDRPNLEVFEKFPDWLKEKIQSGLEYSGSALEKALSGESNDPLDDMDDVPY